MDEDDIDRFRAQWARELPDVDTRGMDVLGRARRVVQQSRAPIEAALARFGVDAGEFDVLATLRRAGPPYSLRPTELFRSLMISSGGLTARLNRLKSAGLIARPQAPDDGRSLLVELTADGARLVERAFREDMAVEARLVSSLSDTEQIDLASLLRKLGRSLSGQG